MKGVYNAPNLAVIALEIDLTGCPVDALLRARVANEGNLGVEANVPVSFHTGTPTEPGELIGVEHTDVPLLPGASTIVEMNAPLEGEGPYEFFATVDDDEAGVGIVLECDEEDNHGAIGDVDCDILQ